LSCDKLKLIHFSPLIAKIDKYLSGWCSLLLKAGGRIILLNAVLDALPAYAMGAMGLPPALLRAIDALRRAFLWNFEGKASGAKCLISWEQVCRPKCEGGAWDQEPVCSEHVSPGEAPSPAPLGAHVPLGELDLGLTARACSAWQEKDGWSTLGLPGEADAAIPGDLGRRDRGW
jgi:hypothetical protein